MIKIIFSDFDNTMLHYYGNKNYFDDYQLDVLKRVRLKGIKFCIVTGRCISFFYQFPDLLKNIDFILASNGSCIYDVRNKKFIHYKFISDGSLQGIVHWAMDNDATFILNSLGKRYKYGDYSYVICDEFNLYKSYVCEQIVLSIGKEKLYSCEKYLSTLHDICVNNITFFDNIYTMDINDIHISKGNGVLWLCQFLSIDLKDTLGFGDGMNDISLFEIVGRSVAVGNACREIKIMANDISLDCENKGIYKYIEENILE